MNKKFMEVAPTILGYCWMVIVLFASLTGAVGAVRLFLRMVGVIV